MKQTSTKKPIAGWAGKGKQPAPFEADGETRTAKIMPPLSERGKARPVPLGVAFPVPRLGLVPDTTGTDGMSVIFQMAQILIHFQCLVTP